MSNPPPVVQLTERDLAILQWVGQAGIATVDQVAKRFWMGRTVATARGRVRQLIRAGYLDAHACNVRRSGEAVLCLTAAAYGLFSPAQRERLHMGLPAPAEIKQQLTAQDAYIQLDAQVQDSGGRLVEWRYERELRAEATSKHQKARGRQGYGLSSDISDARATVITSEGVVETLYVEIDGAYYGTMLCEKARRAANSGERYIWVCTQERAEYLRKALAGYSNINVLVV